MDPANIEAIAASIKGLFRELRIATGPLFPALAKELLAEVALEDVNSTESHEHQEMEQPSARADPRASPEPGQKRPPTTPPKRRKKPRTGLANANNSPVEEEAPPPRRAKPAEKPEAAPGPDPEQHPHIESKTAPILESENQPIPQRKPKQTTIQQATAAPTATIKPSPMPPIICFSDKIAEISRYAKANNIGFTLKNYNSRKTIINTQTEDSYRKMKAHLKERCINYITYTPKADRKNILVVKGIHPSYTDEDIKEELKLEGIPAIKVSIFRSTKAKDKKFNCHVVEVDKSTPIADIIKKTLILNQRVHWEHFKSSGIGQCKNCQGYGHSATNCGMPYVCVKCKDKHAPGECPRKDSTGQDVYCANCKTTGHPANYKGCPVYKTKMAQKLQATAAKKEQQQFAVRSACTLTKPTMSYAAAVGRNFTTKLVTATRKSMNGPNTNQPPKTSQATSVNQPPRTNNSQKQRKTVETGNEDINLGDEMLKTFGKDLPSLMIKARSAIPKGYSSLSAEEKSVALATFLFKLCV